MTEDRKGTECFRNKEHFYSIHPMTCCESFPISEIVDSGISTMKRNKSTGEGNGKTSEIFVR